jgi:cell division septal protein FtsQ
LKARAVYTAKALLGVLALVAASGAFIFTHDYFTQSRQFQARRIEVTGQHRLNRRQVMEIAGVGTQTYISMTAGP